MRLAPGAWEAAVDQAHACINVSPRIALHYWQIAIEGAGHRASEVFGTAMKETAPIPGTTEAWFQYAENHPSLLLTYAEFAHQNAGRIVSLPKTAARDAFDRWWTGRGAVADDLLDAEIEKFYVSAARWGKPEQLAIFQQRHPELKGRDFKRWAALLHGWEKDEEAWQLIASQVPEPDFTYLPPRSDLERLKEGWRLDNHQFVNARDYAAVLTMEARLDPAREVVLLDLAREVIVTVANTFVDAPDWFVRKGAHLLATHREFDKAVALYLGIRKPTTPSTP
jgi:hypothetical protein